MNKTKAYRRLKKKHQHTIHDWIEPTFVRDRIIRLPLGCINQFGVEGDTSVELTMFGMRNVNALKNFIEVVDLEKGPSADISHTSLPNITAKHHYHRNRQLRTKAATSKVNHNTSEDRSVNTSNGYTLLQAKLDALILPTPIKRKVTRSFSGSSSGFHGRKISIGRKDSVTRQTTQGRDEENSTKESGIQFPIASKMRQLLTIEQIEQPAPAQKEKGWFIRCIEWLLDSTVP